MVDPRVDFLFEFIEAASQWAWERRGGRQRQPETRAQNPRITRPLRQRNRLPNRNSANHERPRQEWIEVAVPAVVTEEVFAQAQEQFERNKHFSPRRTRKPTLLQGMLVCQQCGYAMYRSSGGRSHRKLIGQKNSWVRVGSGNLPSE